MNFIFHQHGWENRGRPEYETPYDPLPPNIPIDGTLTLTKYSVDIEKVDGKTLRVTNRLADIEGKVELYTAKLLSSSLEGAGSHAVASTDRTLPAGISQWRVAVAPLKSRFVEADAFLMDCTGKQGCVVAAQGIIGSARRELGDGRSYCWRMANCDPDTEQTPAEKR